ncbi:hypothetical protein [Streptomyces griseoluteus]|uniref:hypothetical protein n=1 Tax=Streptomyces griseoluteus TaxID=29306 RepID=UPI00382AF245
MPGVPRPHGVQRGDGRGVPHMCGGQADHHPAGVGAVPGAPGTAPGYKGTAYRGGRPVPAGRICGPAPTGAS